MKTDIPLKWYFSDTKAERKKKKDLHSNDSIIALKLHGIFRAPDNHQIRNSNHTLGRLGFLLLKRKTEDLWGQLPRQWKSKSWLPSNHWNICHVDPHPPRTLPKPQESTMTKIHVFLWVPFPQKASYVSSLTFHKIEKKEREKRCLRKGQVWRRIWFWHSL